MDILSNIYQFFFLPDKLLFTELKGSYLSKGFSNLVFFPNLGQNIDSSNQQFVTSTLIAFE